MVKDFIPEGFEPDEETEELAKQIRLLEASMSRTTTKPTRSRAADPEPVEIPEPPANKARAFLDEDEGARLLNGGPRGRVHKRF